VSVSARKRAPWTCRPPDSRVNQKRMVMERIMRDLAFLLGVIAMSAVVGMGQNSDDAARAAIRQVIEDQQTSWNRQDLEGFMSGYWNSPDLTFFSGAREAKGWQAALDRYKKSYQGAGHEMGKLEFANLRIEMLGPRGRFCARGIPSEDVGRQDAPGSIHSGLPKIPCRLENCPRSLCRRIKRTGFKVLLPAAVHRIVCQPIGNLVLFPHGVADFEVLEPANQLLCLIVQLAQFRMPDFVNPLHLPDHQFGIADHPERLDLIFGGVAKGGNQSLILGIVVGVVAEVFAKFGDRMSGSIVDGNTVASRPRVPAGSAVDVGSVGGRRGFWSSEELAGGGGAWRHGVEFTQPGLVVTRSNSFYLPVASRVASRCGRFAAMIFSWATRRL
jgi:hypothetical protein